MTATRNMVLAKLKDGKETGEILNIPEGLIYFNEREEIIKIRLDYNLADFKKVAKRHGGVEYLRRVFSFLKKGTIVNLNTGSAGDRLIFRNLASISCKFCNDEIGECFIATYRGYWLSYMRELETEHQLFEHWMP